ADPEIGHLDHLPFGNARQHDEHALAAAYATRLQHRRDAFGPVADLGKCQPPFLTRRVEPAQGFARRIWRVAIDDIAVVEGRRCGRAAIGCAVALEILEWRYEHVVASLLL